MSSAHRLILNCTEGDTVYTHTHIPVSHSNSDINCGRVPNSSLCLPGECGGCFLVKVCCYCNGVSFIPAPGVHIAILPRPTHTGNGNIFICCVCRCKLEPKGAARPFTFRMMSLRSSYHHWRHYFNSDLCAYIGPNAQNTYGFFSHTHFIQPKKSSKLTFQI